MSFFLFNAYNYLISKRENTRKCNRMENKKSRTKQLLCKSSDALKFFEVPVNERETLSILKNPDLQPIPLEDQTWGFWSNFTYWGVCSFQMGTWLSGTAALSVGLSYGETIASFLVGNIVTAFFTIPNSYQGYNWKVGYTISQRFVFGIYGSSLGILVRILMSIVNYGSNAWLGGLCINMILSSWSHHYFTLPNTLTKHVNMNTKELIGFMIFHVISIVCYFLKPRKMNYILITACMASCCGMVGMVIYLTHQADGVGEVLKSSKTVIHGSKRAWAWVYMISYWFGSISPGATNQSDYSRFASSKAAIWSGTLAALLIPATLVPLFGVIGASTTTKLYGKAVWMPMEISDYWLRDGYTAGSRAATFFLGVAFTSAQLAYNISSCGFAGGMDLSGVLPKYINITRGSIITALLSFVVQPWNFFNSSSTFLTVMSSFGVVMTPIISVMLCDNFVIRKQQYSVSEAFKIKGEYYFTWGVNWRAILAFLCAMAPGIPGIVWAVNNDNIANKGIINYYYADTFTSFLISFFLYWLLCLLFPLEINKKHDDKDYYGAFTDEKARMKGMIPFSELAEDEFNEYQYTKGVDAVSACKSCSTSTEKFPFKTV